MTTNLTTKLYGEDLFDNLSKEEEKVNREFNVEKNTNIRDDVLMKIKREFEEFIFDQTSPAFYRPRHLLEHLIKFGSYFPPTIQTLKNFVKQPSQEEIQLFALILPQYNIENIDTIDILAGTYLSALIDISSQRKLSLNLPSSLELTAFGYKNKKHLSIRGNVGDFLGTYMQEGNIELKGDAGNIVGHWMEGGEIHIYGEYKTMSPHTKGTIYHNGKLIIDKGKIIGRGTFIK